MQQKDKELWDNIYNVYVKDELNLGVKKYFEQQNPAALEEMTAVCLQLNIQPQSMI